MTTDDASRQLRIFKATREHYGRCTFCDRKADHFVYVVEGCQIQVRFCRECLIKVKEFKP